MHKKIKYQWKYKLVLLIYFHFNQLIVMNVL